MTFDPTPGATPGTTFRGFAGQPPASAPAPATPPARRAPSRKAVMVGVAGAVGLGLVFGVLARPDFGEDGRAREPMRPAAKTAPAATVPEAGMEIVVNKPPPAAIPKAAGPLEVMSPDLIRAAPRPAPAAKAPAPVIIEASRPEPVAEPVSGYRRAAARPNFARPSFDCGYARSRSEELVCGDAELAAADRRLNRAYRQAVAAGVPARALRAEQDDWLAIREDAARRSPEAVANVYEQRTRELQALSDGPPPDFRDDY